MIHYSMPTPHKATRTYFPLSSTTDNSNLQLSIVFSAVCTKSGLGRIHNDRLFPGPAFLHVDSMPRCIPSCKAAGSMWCMLRLCETDISTVSLWVNCEVLPCCRWIDLHVLIDSWYSVQNCCGYVWDVENVNHKIMDTWRQEQWVMLVEIKLK